MESKKIEREESKKEYTSPSLVSFSGDDILEDLGPARAGSAFE